MRKRIMLAALLGALAIIPASAQGHPNEASPLGIRIIVHDAPKVVHHHTYAERHLRPQPWPRHFKHYAPGPRWRGWPRWPQRSHWRHHDHRPWFDAPGPHHFRHGHAKKWQPAPWQHGRPAMRGDFPDGRFEHGYRRSERRGHHD